MTSTDQTTTDATRHQVTALRSQAASIRHRIRMHGAGMRHGCDTGRSNYCEAFRLILADTEAQIRALEEGGAPAALKAEPVAKNSGTEAAREAAHLEVMTHFRAFYRRKVELTKAGHRVIGVTLPGRLNVPYDGPDATDFQGSLMNLPIAWNPGEKWGLTVEVNLADGLFSG